MRRFVKAWRAEHQGTPVDAYIPLVFEPGEDIYDNMKTAVCRILRGKERDFSRRFEKSLDELNDALRTECLLWAKKQGHPVLKDQTVWSVFETERPYLLTLPRAFDGYAERTVRVSSTSLVSFDRNRYSVACKAAGRTAELRSYADKHKKTTDTVIEETQTKSLYGGAFIEEHRNVVFVGGTGTGKTHLATATASQAVRAGFRAKFFNLADLANQLEQDN